MLETLFGGPLVTADGRVVPVSLVGEQYVREDLATIPSFADWGCLITPQDWMLRGHRLDEPIPLGTMETGAGGAFSGGHSSASGRAFVVEI